MSAVNVTNVAVLDNPSMFLNPFQFEISYECLVPLKDDLEWKLIYVGSAEDEKYDQVLESVLVGPVNVGNYRFVFQADPPEIAKIPEEDIIGVTVLLLTCSYQGQEFIRVGYYVSNDYVEEALREEPPVKVVIEKVQRNILADKPRVTKFPIVFHSAAPVMDHIEAENVADGYALPPPPSRDVAMQTDEACGSPSSPVDSMDEKPSSEACVIPSSPSTELMHTDEEASESNQMESPATEVMHMDGAKPADLHTPQGFDSMQHPDGVRQGELHTPQALQEVC